MQREKSFERKWSMRVQEIVFVAEIRTILRGGCRQRGKSSHNAATGDRTGYSHIRQE